MLRAGHITTCLPLKLISNIALQNITSFTGNNCGIAYIEVKKKCLSNL